MHRNVGPAFAERHFKLLDKQALAADLAQRAVQNLVALRGHAEQFDLPAQTALQQRLDMPGLPHRQTAFARGDDDLQRRQARPVQGNRRARSCRRGRCRCFRHS